MMHHAYIRVASIGGLEKDETLQQLTLLPDNCDRAGHDPATIRALDISYKSSS